MDITKPSKEEIKKSLAAFGPNEDIDYIVVSDGESILGIGDQGTGAIGISIAKLALMTLCAGVHPSRVIPISLDVGTDRESLLEDPLYLGNKFKRVRGEEYDNFIENFVTAVKESFPNAVLHFEDFGVKNAHRILDKYSEELACFNDDIQGTGAVTLSAMTAALKSIKHEITDCRVLVYGAGSAGMGIAEQITDHLLTKGLTPEEAREKIWLIDRDGLLTESSKNVSSDQKLFAVKDELAQGFDNTSLKEIIANFKPHVLVGCSTQAGAFTEECVKEMNKHAERPIIFPLSNPTRLHEAKPADLIKWTGGDVLCATGSPFPPVNGRVISENNNCFTFPGIGLGAVLSRSTHITKNMIAACVESLSSQSPILTDPAGGLLPDIRNIREISAHVATSVVRQALKDGVAQVEKEKIPGTDIQVKVPDGYNERLAWVKSQMWTPNYRDLKKVGPELDDEQVA